jgi:Zn-dependent protease with chaperone function
MQLFYFLFVIISLSCGSLPAAAPVEPWLSLVGTMLLVGIWWLLCHVGAHIVARQVHIEQLGHLIGAGWIERQLEAFRWLSLVVVVLCLWGFGLAAAVDAVPVMADSMFLQSIVLLTPGLVMIAATWSAEHWYGVQLKYCKPGFRGNVAMLIGAFRSSVAWLVLPVILLLGLVDLIGLLPIRSEVAGVVAIGITALVIVIALPRLIPRLFGTSPLDDQTSDWINDVLSAAGIGKLRVVRWDTGNQAFNAMVVGFVRPFRTLLVSDRLLAELPKEQIAMVLLHEAAHLRRRHVPLRMLAVLPAWISGALVTRLAGEETWGTLLGSLIAILLTMLILRIVAYRTEFDADIQACKTARQIAGRCDAVPAGFEHASDVLSAALMRVTFDNPAARRASWLHPGVADRVAWMRRYKYSPITTSSSAGTIANPA